MNKLIVSWVTVLTLIMLCACTVGPDYCVPPPVEVPCVYKEGEAQSKSKEERSAMAMITKARKGLKGKVLQSIAAPEGFKMAEPCDDCDRRLWWRAFHNKELDQLELLLNANNQNLIGLWANYRQAIALVDVARAAYWPTLTFFGSETRQKPSKSSNSSTTSANGAAGVGSVGPTGTTGVNSPSSISNGTGGTALNNTSASTGQKIFNNYSLSLSATWVPDFFGLVTRTVEAAEASADATAAQFALTRLTLQATLAQTYFELRTLDSIQNLLEELITSYQKLVTIAENRYKQGVVQQFDILQARAQLENAHAIAVDNGITRAQYEHAIAVLIGRPPAEFCLATTPLKTPPPRIPKQLPSCLLERRPDIAQAERFMAQANANVGVQVAAFFPTITLTADGGVSSNMIRTLFNRPSRFWAIGAEIAEQLLDGGQREANTRAAYAAFEQSVANYRQTVLSAFQNVEDNLVALRRLKTEIEAYNLAVNDQKQALDVVMNQYKSGVAQMSDVILQQNTYYTARESAINTEGRRMIAAVGLVMALGGGWDTSDICDLRGSSNDCCPPVTLPSCPE